MSKAGCLDTCKCYEQAANAPATAPLSLAALTPAEFEAKMDQIDADYEAYQNAINQAERFALEAIRLKYNADLAALKA